MPAIAFKTSRKLSLYALLRPKRHDHSSCVSGQMTCYSYQVVNDSTDSAAFYRTLCFRRTASPDRVITDDSENVEYKDSQVKYESVRFELSGRKPLYIHIGLDLAVVLLTFSMCVIGCNDVCIRDQIHRVCHHRGSWQPSS